MSDVTFIPGERLRAAKLNRARTVGIAELPTEARLIPLYFAASDETTAITSGNSRVVLYVPRLIAPLALFVSLNTASSSGPVTVVLRAGGTSILAAPLSILQGANTAETSAFVVQTIARATRLDFDITAAGTGAAGLKVFLDGYAP